MIKAWAGLLGHQCGHRTVCLLGATPALEERTYLWCLTLHQVQEKETSAWPQLPGPRGRNSALTRGQAVMRLDPGLLSLSWDLVAPSLSSALLGPSLHCLSWSPIA